MMLIGVDYHPSLQTIEFFVEEAARNQRAGRHGGYRIFTLVRAVTG